MIRLALAFLLLVATSAEVAAREVRYDGGELPVYVTPGEPTQIEFQKTISGGFKRKNAAVQLQRHSKSLIVFAEPQIAFEGEAILVFLADGQSYALRILPAAEDHPRDWFVKVTDERESYLSGEASSADPRVAMQGFPSPATVPGLMRELVLRAEFGKQQKIEGYRALLRHVGEVVLDDGTLSVKVEDIVVGPQYWGYILIAENLLESGQKLNPATFQLEGTRAVSAKNWELSARPTTAEQKIASGHISKIYVVTKAHRM